MPNISEQRIMIYDQPNYTSDETIRHGMQIARIFNKELCFFRAIPSYEKSAKRTAQHQLSLLIQKWRPKLPDIPFSSLVLKGSLVQTISKIAEKYDGILLIVPSAAPDINQKFKALQESPIPFLFIPGNGGNNINYHRILVPFDFRKVMKNTGLWASYLARFNKSQVTILNPGKQNQELEAKTQKNNQFIHKLFKKFNLNLEIQKSQKGNFALPFDALKMSQTNQFNLLIIPSSQNISLLDYLIGLPERKIIRKAQTLPVLCINPQRDMYILCD